MPVTFGAVGLKPTGMDNPHQCIVHRRDLERVGLNPDRFERITLFDEIPKLKNNVFSVYVDGEDAEPWERTERNISNGKLVFLYRDGEAGEMEDVWFSPDRPDDPDTPLTPERMGEWKRHIDEKGFVSQTREWLDHLQKQLLEKLVAQYGE